MEAMGYVGTSMSLWLWWVKWLASELWEALLMENELQNVADGSATKCIDGKWE